MMLFITVSYIFFSEATELFFLTFQRKKTNGFFGNYFAPTRFQTHTRTRKCTKCVAVFVVVFFLSVCNIVL